ncbi:rhodanese-like domain-containing protein [Paenibacillus woosongensis]|uniref:Rhodanese-like domain-containing protein n=1 Tax=Paenibacillus woosongensis TaxID=307580 RepID=A0A7X3CNP3_9BACL|nr:rhodanese-like domain-containing protein [Paenibacillus woosongensis]MUG46019.1 rhodanese-like domain-containing protein [Paenibacillus woosongensis]
MSEVIQGVSHIDTKELSDILQDPGNRTIIIDVREPEEYIQAHIPGVPLIPMGEIIGYMDDLDPEREYVFICRSGQRSFNVAKYFQQNGFDAVHNYAGGMLDWDGEMATGLENVIEQPLDPKKLER